jgi:transcriptional regulator with XRE-family HTH domain
MNVQLLHHVGNRLKTLRTGQGLSVEEVKATTGIAVTKIETGEKDMPIDKLAVLCDHYRTNLVDFFKEIEKQLS